MLCRCDAACSAAAGQSVGHSAPVWLRRGQNSSFASSALAPSFVRCRGVVQVRARVLLLVRAER